VPEACLNVVAGPGAWCGKRLVEHPDVAKIAFTRSTEVGRTIAHGRRDDQRLTLELAKFREHVFADAILERAAFAAPSRCSGTPARTAARASRSSSSARWSIASSRHWRKPVAALRVGDPLDEDDPDGPLISRASRETVSVRSDDAPVAIRGSGADGPGYWFAPTVLAPVSNEDRAATERYSVPSPA